MTLVSLILREILARKAGFLALCLLGAAPVTASLLLAASLQAHERQTQALVQEHIAASDKLLDELKDQIRRQMKGLGFNVLVLPPGENVALMHERGYPTGDMPEEAAHELARSGPESLNHLLPSLSGRWHWPEQRRSVLLIGIRGELPMGHASEAPSGALIDPLAEGEVAVGYEIARDLELKAGSSLELGAAKWTVKTVYPMRANSDDISVWLPLAAAQQLFGKPGRINSILALQCNCRDEDLMALIRQEVQAVLPGHVVLEKGSQALARAEARKAVRDNAEAQLDLLKEDRARQYEERRVLAERLIGGALVAGLLIFGLAAAGNANGRRQEIALLASLGFRRSRIFLLLLSRILLAALFAAVLGFGYAALTCALHFDTRIFELVAPAAILGVLAAAIPCALFAAWLPCLAAVRRDPASLLKEERL
ncbi:MAG: Macrolide export ATP-binding/permease protein MacB [Verrucomicrobiota bacterium]|jgi:hypothetical protein